jgi:Hg(II)-responsive transcriptional regulator
MARLQGLLQANSISCFLMSGFFLINLLTPYYGTGFILKMRKTMKELTIGALAKAAGVNVETIRFYERRGLLRRPPKPAEGYRRYPNNAVQQVRFIKGAQRLGFSLKEITELLTLGGQGELNCAEMRDLAGRKVAEIDHKMAALEAMKSTLLELAETCPGAGNLALCPIWERMANMQERKEVNIMSKRKVEVFSAGCPVCADLVDLVKATACPSCEVTIYNLSQGQGTDEAKRYGITAVPAVVVEGKLLDCCKRAHITKHDLEAAGIGKPL